jgi:hypothetical protein
VFLASSIVNSLKNNKGIIVYGLDLIICPVKSCIAEPSECSKGQNESCVKKVDIVYEHDGHNKVTILLFHYQLKGYNREGYIKADDLSLKILIDRGIINKKDLIETN